MHLKSDLSGRNYTRRRVIILSDHSTTNRLLVGRRAVLITVLTRLKSFCFEERTPFKSQYSGYSPGTLEPWKDPSHMTRLRAPGHVLTKVSKYPSSVRSTHMVTTKHMEILIKTS